ncbi:hypothetical protein HQ585_16070 [candidate division KSB1 bacterium]|nr:hypothetical protein [candidate division KSB1 bacterium]
MKWFFPILLTVLIVPVFAQAQWIVEEQDGLVAVETEHYVSQSQTETRQWILCNAASVPSIKPDIDPIHKGASGGAYLEILPDTRQTHDDPLVHEVSFSNVPGILAILTYKIQFNNTGRYYVWVRAFSTGSEDNGIHVGLDGEWPEHGQRMQWCEGKHTWRWESKQRTDAEHCGVFDQIYLDIPTIGIHDIHFSMREDGFEFDKFILTTNIDFPRPDSLDTGPMEILFYNSK